MLSLMASGIAETDLGACEIFALSPKRERTSCRVRISAALCPSCRIRSVEGSMTGLSRPAPTFGDGRALGVLWNRRPHDRAHRLLERPGSAVAVGVR
jgi:hypothetical protein